MNGDKRTEIYHALQKQQSEYEAQTHQSASRILSLISHYIELRSVLDVGCGLGTWLKTACELGVQEVMGIEGPWLDRNAVVVDLGLIQIMDLEQPFSLGRRFDLVICLEVAEHLRPAAASNLVGALAAHGDCVLFSAAVPFQGGNHHVNEQFLDYWIKQFATQGYRPMDIVRGHIWEDTSVHWWLRQNCILFCSQQAIEGNEKLRKERDVVRPLAVVHPTLYMMWTQGATQRAKEHQNMANLLGRGGNFNAQPQPDGTLIIKRLPT
ncbi:MAG: methyltransferase domain-containing protein [Tepidisphaeraceae bacterium]|jgi:SAM-dependent methyltransferase